MNPRKFEYQCLQITKKKNPIKTSAKKQNKDENKTGDMKLNWKAAVYSDQIYTYTLHLVYMYMCGCFSKVSNQNLTNIVVFHVINSRCVST